MDQVKTLMVNVLETDGKVSIAISQGIALEDGSECTRTKHIKLPSDPSVCCNDCWMDQVLVEASEVGESVAWKYFHSEACGHLDKESADA